MIYKTLWLATSNQHKIKEIFNFFKKHKGLHFKTLKDLSCYQSPEETGLSFQENAKIKALALFKILQKNKLFTRDTLIMAEDSGLEVQALKGEPGVYSARYSGPHAKDQKNNQLLLHNMKNKKNRKAQYICSLYIIHQQNSHYHFEACCRGLIASKESGSNGFGYDSLFIPENHTQTFGLLSNSDKQSLSHRAQALMQFEKQIIKSNLF